MSHNPIINEDGSPFTVEEIEDYRRILDNLISNDEREHYRNVNSAAIATHPAASLLIVSGPGTGTSYIFIHRISHWLSINESANILVTTFVRKLVDDLENEVESQLSPQQQRQVQAYTLHRFARSLVEKNGGTRTWPLGKHVSVISQDWKEIIWEDVLRFIDDKDSGKYSSDSFHHQLHDAVIKETMATTFSYIFSAVWFL